MFRNTQTLYVHNDFNSIYCRFSVEPDENNQVVLEFVGAPTSTGYTVPRISALFFDPQETHLTKYQYTDENYPKKVTKTTDAYGYEATTQYNADGTVAQSSNFRSKITKYTYTDDAYARITCVEDPLGNKTWTNYDTKGRVVSTVDARGSGPDDEDHMTKNEYDDDGNLISTTDPLGNKTTYLYDGSGKLISQTDPTGWVTYYNTDDDSGTTEVKDALGRVISSTDKDGKTTYYEYDTDSHLVKITDPNGAISTNTYDAIGRMEASSDFEGNITRYEYDVMGRTVKTTAPDGGETSYEYDVKGRITKTTYPDETTTETTYDIYGNVKTTTDRAGNVTENFYDRLNRVIKIKDPAGNYTYYEYDENGNRTAVRDPRSSSAADDTYKISYIYDDNDRLTRIDYPDSTYETTVYDAVGNATSKTDRKGQTTTYTFNNANRLTTITYTDETTTEYTYDAAGRVLSVTQPDGSTTYTKSLGNVTREYKLDFEGNIVYDYYTQYDDNGRMIKFIDATNATLATLPAVFNKVKYNENFNKLGYISNAILGQNFKYGEEGAGNRKYRQQEDQDERVAKFGTILFGTDPIKYAEEAGPGAVLSTKYNYDDDSDESGSATGTGVLKSITDPFGKDYSFQRIENGSRTLYPNNTFTDRAYDELGRLETIAHKRRNPSDGSETVLQSFTYQYDDSGNITKITEANGEYIDYNYDNLNRLTEEHRKTAAGDTIYNIEYTFDDNSSKNGNIHRVIYDGKHVTTFTYNEMNELTGITHPDSSTETLTYDNNGNLTQTVNNTTGETTAYEWDCFDRLTKVIMPPKYGSEKGEEIIFTYNGEDELIKIAYPDMTIDMKESKGDFVRKTAKFRFNGQKTPSDVEMSSFDIYIMGQLLCKYSSTPDAASTSRNSGRNTGEPRFYHYDHNGNMALITDEYGNITNKILMDAYGNVLPLEAGNESNSTKTIHETLMSGMSGMIYLYRIRTYLLKKNIVIAYMRKLLSITTPELLNQANSNNYETINARNNSYKRNNPINNDVFESDKWEQQRLIMVLLNQASIYCRKIEKVVQKLPYDGKNRPLIFRIGVLSDITEMVTCTNKFSDTFRPPLYYDITINSIKWYEIEMDIPKFSVILAHEFVHVQNDLSWDKNNFDKYFLEWKKGIPLPTGPSFCTHPSSKKDIWTFEIVQEYRAYYVAWKIAEKIKHPIAQEAKYLYNYYREVLFDKDCCIDKKFKVDIQLAHYC